MQGSDQRAQVLAGLSVPSSALQLGGLDLSSTALLGAFLSPPKTRGGGAGGAGARASAAQQQQQQAAAAAAAMANQQALAALAALGLNPYAHALVASAAGGGAGAAGPAAGGLGGLVTPTGRPLLHQVRAHGATLKAAGCQDFLLPRPAEPDAQALAQALNCAHAGARRGGQGQRGG